MHDESHHESQDGGSLAEALRRSRDERRLIRLETADPDGNAYDGIVMMIHSDFVAICPETDFEFDGIQLVARKHLTGYRDGAFEACWQEILIHSGEINRLAFPAWVEGCADWRAFFTAVRSRDVWPGIEVIVEGGAESALYIGPVLTVGETSLTLLTYDAAGAWEKSYEIDYAEIFRVDLETKYCSRFNDFMRAKGLPERPGD